MSPSRRAELLLGAAAFAALAAAFGWLALEWWWTGAMRWSPLAPPVGGVAGAMVATVYAALAVGTVLAAALVLRARWTPPLPGNPVERANGGQAGQG